MSRDGYGDTSFGYSDRHSLDFLIRFGYRTKHNLSKIVRIFPLSEAVSFWHPDKIPVDFWIKHGLSF